MALATVHYSYVYLYFVDKTRKKNRQTSLVYDCTVGDVEYVAAIFLLS